jgi:transposase
MIRATEIKFQTYGQTHSLFDREIKSITFYDIEIKKTNPLAKLISVERKSIEPSLLLSKNFRRLKQWNTDLQAQFDHIDKEALV